MVMVGYLMDDIVSHPYSLSIKSQITKPVDLHSVSLLHNICQILFVMMYQRFM